MRFFSTPNDRGVAAPQVLRCGDQRLRAGAGPGRGRSMAGCHGEGPEKQLRLGWLELGCLSNICKIHGKSM